MKVLSLPAHRKVEELSWGNWICDAEDILPLVQKASSAVGECQNNQEMWAEPRLRGPILYGFGCQEACSREKCRNGTTQWTGGEKFYVFYAFSLF